MQIYGFQALATAYLHKYYMDNFNLKITRKSFPAFTQNHYICNMRQKIGDWFLDVAKYILTAVLLSSMFNDMKNPFVFAGVIFAFIAAFGIGIYLNKKSGEKNNGNN